MAVWDPVVDVGVVGEGYVEGERFGPVGIEYRRLRSDSLHRVSVG